MNDFIQPVEIRWSDLDPNFHLRHSVYYDWGAYTRMAFLTANGLGASVMIQQQIGPILFREECVFKREIHFGDRVQLNVKLLKSTRDMSRWSMQHEVWKNDNTLSAVITVDGAWINTALRKLAIPPDHFRSVFEQIPRSEEFSWSE